MSNHSVADKDSARSIVESGTNHIPAGDISEHVEFIRQEWRRRAIALGSTMSDEGTTYMDWYREHTRVQWRKLARDHGSTMTDDDTGPAGWYAEYYRVTHRPCSEIHNSHRRQ